MEKITLNVDENTVPTIAYGLSSIPEESIPYSEYGFRHPAAIFNMKFGTVVRRLRDLILLVYTEDGAKEDIDKTRVLEIYRLFLDELNNFYECGYEMIAGCCPRLTPRKDKEIYRWLKNNKIDASKKYYTALREDMEFFRELNNDIKHSGKRLAYVGMENAGINIHGYFLEGVDKSGAIVPDLKFHPLYRRQRTGKSFNYEIRRAYYCILKISKTLDNCLHQQMRLQNIELKTTGNINLGEGANIAKETFDLVSKLPSFFFPDEKIKSIPYPSISDEPDRKVEVYILVNPGLILEQAQIQITLSGDGHSKSFGLLYSEYSGLESIETSRG